MAQKGNLDDLDLKAHQARPVMMAFLVHRVVLALQVDLALQVSQALQVNQALQVKLNRLKVKGDELESRVHRDLPVHLVHPVPLEKQGKLVPKVNQALRVTMVKLGIWDHLGNQVLKVLRARAL